MLTANWQLLEVGRASGTEDLVPAWKRLAARAMVPAGLNRPEIVLPLMCHLEGAQVATVRSGPDLLLALPVYRKSLPPVLTNWVTPLTPSGLPHLDRDQGKAALEAFLRWEAGPLMLTGIPASGPFWDTLPEASHRFAVVDRWERAALRPKGNFNTWFETNFDRKRRKEYRRLRARLGEQGRLESVALRTGEDVLSWVKALLELEAAGWKGRRGTALNQDRALAQAFTEAAMALHAAGRLRFWSLRLDGRTIATLFAIVEGDQAWLGKIAYDEAFAKFSPGVLLILDATETFFVDSGIAVVDSCAIPGHPMIENIWRDRIAIADVMVAAASTAPAKFAVMTGAEKFRRRARGAARDIYLKITRRHRS